MEKALAVIPARGGSQGVLRKNLRPVGGRPLIERTIAAAKSAASVGRVIVTTDDPDIERRSLEAGAEAVRRPTVLSGPEASSEGAVLHVLDELEARGESLPALIVFLQCTSPLTTGEDIDGTVQALLADRADSALAVTPEHAFLWRPGPTGWTGVNHEPAVRPMRQQRPPEYRETGAVYVMRTAGFRAARHRFFGRITAHVMPRERSWEIDEAVDLEIAEALLAARGRPAAPSVLPDPVTAVVFDFDGVFTDNRALVDETGREAVFVNRGDGHWLKRLQAAGIPLLVLSGETNPVVGARCLKLGVPCISGVANKGPALATWLAENHLAPQGVVYVGNGENDCACLSQVGCPVVVADAEPEARQAAALTLTSRGGEGAVAEVCRLILMEKR